MEKKNFHIDSRLCKGCGICAALCPSGTIVIDEEKAVWRKDNCVFCGICEEHCPSFAIAVSKGTTAPIDKMPDETKSEMLPEAEVYCPDNSGPVLMQGNEACVEGALAAGMRFFAGYPITPSTEIAERCALLLPKLGGTFIQMEDEMGSIGAVVGAAAAGIMAMTATSGPGFSLQQEFIGYAAAAEIPCVIVNVQRVGPGTGLPTASAQGDVMQSRWGSHGDRPAIVISPSSVKECWTLIGCCFRLARRFRTPVIFLMDEQIAHLRESVELQMSEILPIKNERFGFNAGVRCHITGLIHDSLGRPIADPERAESALHALLEKLPENSEELPPCEEYMMDDAEIAVACFGGTARSVKEAVAEARRQGLAAGMLRFVTIWPFPQDTVRHYNNQIHRWIAAEHNGGQLSLEVERAVGTANVKRLERMGGELIRPEQVLSALKEAAQTCVKAK